MGDVRIGTAGWSIPSARQDAFPFEGSHLERYAQRLRAVEINSSFYRPHRRKTYERWADSVDDDFRFSAKLPKSISHARYAPELEPEIERFSDEISGLGPKLGAVLVQFPPSLAYDAALASALLSSVLVRIPCPLVCEPRHVSWFTPPADAHLDDLRVARVAADPSRAPGSDEPGGWLGLRYYRLHGSPHIYRSAYDGDALDTLRQSFPGEADEAATWCIFDNTTLGAATANALDLDDLITADANTRHAVERTPPPSGTMATRDD